MRTPSFAQASMACLCLLLLSAKTFGQTASNTTEIISYDPVCAANGKSYPNLVAARSAGNAHFEKGCCASYRPVACQDPNRLWISLVEVNGMSEKSGASGYTNASNVVFELYQYGSNIISLDRKPDTDIGVQQWKVWVDFDGDTFFEPNEIILDAAAKDIAIPVEIPKNVPPGTLTRMRVFVGQIGTSLVSDTIPFGEVEDYTVEIVR